MHSPISKYWCEMFTGWAPVGREIQPHNVNSCQQALYTHSSILSLQLSSQLVYKHLCHDDLNLSFPCFNPLYLPSTCSSILCSLSERPSSKCSLMINGSYIYSSRLFWTGSKLWFKGTLWLHGAAVFTCRLVMSLCVFFKSKSSCMQYTNVCNNSDSKICWQTELRNCRFNGEFNIKIKVFCLILSTYLKIHLHIAEYFMIKCCWNGIIAQLRHCGCIGLHIDYWSHIIKADGVSTLHNILSTYLILIFTLTLLMPPNVYKNDEN